MHPVGMLPDEAFPYGELVKQILVSLPPADTIDLRGQIDRLRDAYLRRESLTLLEQGKEYVTLGRYKEALELFNRASDFNSNDPAVYHHKALALFGLDDYQQACTQVEWSLAIDAEKAFFWENCFLLGELFDRLGNREASERWLSMIIGIRHDFNSLRRLGQLCYDINFISAAISCFESAVECSPSAQSHFYLGTTYFKANRHTDAVRHLAHAAEMSHHDKLYLFWLGRAYLSVDNLSDAQSCLDRSAGCQGIDHWIWFYQGIVRFRIATSSEECRTEEDRRNLLSQSLECITNSLRAKPTNSEYIFWMGRIYHELGDTDSAIGRIVDAITPGDPSAGEAYHWLGRVYFDVGQWELAKRCLTQAHECNYDPGAVTRKYLGLAYFMLHEYGKAYNMFSQCVNTSQNDVICIIGLSKCLAHLDRTGESAIFRKCACDLHTGNIDATWKQVFEKGNSRISAEEEQRHYRATIDSWVKEGDMPEFDFHRFYTHL